MGILVKFTYFYQRDRDHFVGLDPGVISITAGEIVEVRAQKPILTYLTHSFTKAAKINIIQKWPWELI